MSYATEVKLLVAWLVLAVLTAVVLMVVLLVRQPPEPDRFWRTVRRYFLLSALICCFLPALLLAGRTAIALYEWGAPTMLGYWWLPLAALAVAALGFGGWWLYRWERATPEPAPVAPDAMEGPQIAAQPVEMWSMPSDAVQWDTDSLPR